MKTKIKNSSHEDMVNKYGEFINMYQHKQLIIDFINDLNIDANVNDFILPANLPNLLMSYYDYCINFEKPSTTDYLGYMKTNYANGISLAENKFDIAITTQKKIIEKYIRYKNGDNISEDDFLDILYLLIVYHNSVSGKNNNLEIILTHFIIDFYIKFSKGNKLDYSFLEKILKSFFEKVYKNSHNIIYEIVNFYVSGATEFGSIIRKLYFILEEYEGFYEHDLHYIKYLYSYLDFYKQAENQIVKWGYSRNIMKNIPIIAIWGNVTKNRNLKIEDKKLKINEIVIKFEEHIKEKWGITKIIDKNGKEVDGKLQLALEKEYRHIGNHKGFIKNIMNNNNNDDMIDYILKNYDTLESELMGKFSITDSLNAIFLQEFRNEKSHKSTKNRDTDLILLIIIKTICSMY
jgi:hypothetical protein